MKLDGIHFFRVPFLQKNFPYYAWDADFFWDQPLKGSALVDVGSANGTSGGESKTGAASVDAPRIMGCVFVVLLSLLGLLL